MDLEKFSKYKMPFNKMEMRKRIVKEHHNILKSTSVKLNFVRKCSVFKGYLIEQIYVYYFEKPKKKNKTIKDIEVIEVERKIQTEKQCLRRYVENGMAGYRLCFWGTGRFYKCDATYSYASAIDITDKPAIINELNIPYCCYFHENNTTGLNFYDYIVKYMKYPKMELLIKGGYASCHIFIHMLNWKQKELHKIFKVEQNQTGALKGLDYNLYMIVKKHKFVKKIEQAKAILEIPRNYRFVNDLFEIHGIEKVVNYFIRLNNVQRIEYNDYLSMMHTLLNNYKFNLFPKDVTKSHNRTLEEYKLKEAKKFEKEDRPNIPKWKEIYKKDKRKTFENSVYKIVIPNSPQEVRAEGLSLNHCVGGYIKRILNKETKIYFLRKLEEMDSSYYTIEVINKKVEQVRGKCNCAPNDEIKSFIKEWADKNKFEYRV